MSLRFLDPRKPLDRELIIELVHRMFDARLFKYVNNLFGRSLRVQFMLAMSDKYPKEVLECAKNAVKNLAKEPSTVLLSPCLDKENNKLYIVVYPPEDSLVFTPIDAAHELVHGHLSLLFGKGMGVVKAKIGETYRYIILDEIWAEAIALAAAFKFYDESIIAEKIVGTLSKLIYAIAKEEYINSLMSSSNEELTPSSWIYSYAIGEGLAVYGYYRHGDNAAHELVKELLKYHKLYIKFQNASDEKERNSYALEMFRIIEDWANIGYKTFLDVLEVEEKSIEESIERILSGLLQGDPFI